MLLKTIEDDRGSLVVNSIPSHLPAFPVRRFFLINGKTGIPRGNHAHRTCWQILIIISGNWKISLQTLNGINITDSGHKPAELTIVEPNTWAEIEPLSDDAQMLVLCDKEYDEADYIRDHDQFLQLQKEYRKTLKYGITH